jgi:hypothetical protein
MKKVVVQICALCLLFLLLYKRIWEKLYLNLNKDTLVVTCFFLFYLSREGQQASQIQ